MNEHTCSATSPSDALIRAATPGSVAETPGAFANMDDQLPPHRPPARSTEPKLLEQAQPGLDLIHRFPSRGSWRRMPPGKAEPGEERGFPGGAWTGWAFHQERFLSKSEALDLGRQERDWAYLRAAEPVMPWLPGGTPPPSPAVLPWLRPRTFWISSSLPGSIPIPLPAALPLARHTSP